jgi:NAD(P)-dependent dehydrogenase (short-subunit alcohol dehydrogenase family)
MGQRALVIGASGGIGSAVADQLEESGHAVSRLSRSEDGLDLLREETVRAAAGRLTGPFDLILDATGALEIEGRGPEKALAQIEPQALAAQFALNAIGPALLLKHFHAHLPRGRRAVFATLSARVGSIGDNRLGGWISYRASKAALNQIVRTASIEIARKWPEAIVVALHPGTVRSSLSEQYLDRHKAVGPKEAAVNLIRVMGSLTRADTGGFFAWDGKAIPW